MNSSFTFFIILGKDVEQIKTDVLFGYLVTANYELMMFFFISLITIKLLDVIGNDDSIIVELFFFDYRTQ